LGPNDWEWKRYHVAVAERCIKRDIGRKECVHHINLDTLSNDVSNLHVMTTKDHKQCHISLWKCALELYKIGLVGFDKKTGKYFVTNNKE
jgi:hypothetical protein